MKNMFSAHELGFCLQSPARQTTADSMSPLTLERDSLRYKLTSANETDNRPWRGNKNTVRVLSDVM